MHEDLYDDLELALEAALAAGRAAAAWFGGALEVRHKGPDQPLTEADLEANRVLRTRLVGARPEYGWLSEETADAPERLDRRRVWIVDPVDGTKSFIAGEPEFSVSVGLVEDGAAVLGVVYNPATGEVYWALAGEGAWAGRAVVQKQGGGKGKGMGQAKGEGEGEGPGEGQGEGEGEGPGEGEVSSPGGKAGVAAGLGGVRRVRVTAGEGRVMLASRSEIGAGEFDPFREGWRLVPLGSTAYKLALVGAGEGDAFVSRGPKSEWDVCAGGLIVAEAGGRATDLRGEPLRYNQRDPRVYGILATNGDLHAAVLRAVGEMPPPARLSERRSDPLHPGLDEEEA